MARALEAVVVVDGPTGSRSGFFIGPDVLLTASATLSETGVAIVTTATGARAEATRAAVDQTLGLAVLRLTSPLPVGDALPLGSIDGVRAGAVLAILGRTSPSRVGVTDATVVSIATRSGHAVLRLDTAPPDGAVGGPVIDSEGRVVGVVSQPSSAGTSHRDAPTTTAIDQARSLIERARQADRTAGPANGRQATVQ